MIIFSEQEDKLFFANLVLNINSSVAASLAIFVTIKDKDKSSLKANIFLVIGLVLWFAANIVWAYYEVIEHLMAPVPSFADVLLLSAYSILIVRLYIEYKSLQETNQEIYGSNSWYYRCFLSIYFQSYSRPFSSIDVKRSANVCSDNSISSFQFCVIVYGNNHFVWIKERKGNR